MTALSVNPATALHNILEQMMYSDRDTIQDGWAAVLGAHVGTVDFAQRHGEVIALLNGVGARLRGLPEGNRTRERCLPYIPSWYQALVYTGPWGSSQHPARIVIDKANLDQLGTVGDLFDTLFDDERTALSDDALAQLRRNLGEWRDLLDEADLPRGIASQIRAQVNHIEWLLDNVGTFGSQPIVDRTRELVGSGVSAVAVKPKLSVKIGSALTGAVMFLGLVHQGVDQANGILEGVQKMTTYVQQIADGDFVPPKELTAVPTLPADEVVDAEVVAEDATG